jgi:hypothetical protein
MWRIMYKRSTVVCVWLRRYVRVIGIMCQDACFCAANGRMALGGKELCTTMRRISVGGKEIAL